MKHVAVTIDASAVRRELDELRDQVQAEHDKVERLVRECVTMRTAIRALANWKAEHGKDCLSEGLIETRMARMRELETLAKQRESADTRVLDALDALVAAEPAPLVKPLALVTH